MKNMREGDFALSIGGDIVGHCLTEKLTDLMSSIVATNGAPGKAKMRTFRIGE